MLYHSVSAHAADHHCCSHETCETFVKHKNTDGISLTRTDEDCPICNYHFATKDYQDITVAEVQIPMFASNYNAIANQENYLPAIGNKSPRAPPVHIA
ncbi:hypothetical protein [Carboxylicivirga sp. RSCT41]|uniref:hypothetical protein n=1 Tax=Carboxylicivirga agarovorans TaxID=3417570 RepID=UPI003D3272F4